MEDANLQPDPLSRLRHVIDQEFNLEKLLRLKDVSELNNLEEKVVYLLEESSKPYLSPVSVVNPSPIFNNRKDSQPVVFQDTNGRFLQLSCNICRRNNFTSVQGLINHCQKVHNVNLNNIKQAVTECAQVIETIPFNADIKQLQYAVSVSPTSPHPDNLLQSPMQAEDGRMKRGAMELPRLKLKITNNKEPVLFIRKKIIIGNINQFITPDKRALNYEKCAYSWLIYIRTKHAVDITTFVKKVRFYLHASYKPHEVVDINRPPFYIMRLGWGEFIARIQIFFHDTKNAPIDIPYHLKLDQQTTGKELLGDEKHYDLHLHKETQFIDPEPFPGCDKIPLVSNDSPIESSFIEEPATAIQHPQEQQIPEISSCNKCGGDCPNNSPNHLYPSTTEGFHHIDLKTSNALKIKRILPQIPVREPIINLDLNEINDKIGLVTTNPANEEALVLLAAVIYH